jgi:hypothetical protein
MAELDDALAQYSIHAVRSAAERLGVEPLALARRLHGGEIFRLLRLLNAALPHVSTPGLRHRIEDQLSSITDGRMPMFERAETELDWALEAFRARARNAEPGDPTDAADPLDDRA